MKTIEYRFIPINQRDRLELDDLYRRIQKESPNKYQYTHAGKQKLIRWLSVKKRLDLIKRMEITRIITNQLDGDVLNSAIVDCGALGTLSFFWDEGYHFWMSGFVFADSSEITYKVLWI